MLPPRILRAKDQSILTNAADGGAKPKQEALRFVSTALHSLPTVEVRTGRFSEGIFARSEDVYRNGLTAFRGSTWRSNRAP